MVICIFLADSFIIDLDVEPNDTIGNVKVLISFEQGISYKHQRLRFEGVVLEDESTLSDNNIKDRDTLKLCVEVICKCVQFSRVYVVMLFIT